MLIAAGRVAWLACVALVPVAARAAHAAAPAQVRVNGVPFALQMRVIEGEPAVLAQRLDGRWGARLVSPAAAAASRPAVPAAPPGAAAREMLGRQRGPFHETLTLLPGPRPGTSHALVAVQDLRRRPAPMPRPSLPLPAGSSLLNVVEFGDGAGASALFSATAGEGPQMLVERLARAARVAGWQVAGLPAAATQGGASFSARRGARELTVVATPAADGSRLQLLEASGRGEQPW